MQKKRVFNYRFWTVLLIGIIFCSLLVSNIILKNYFIVSFSALGLLCILIYLIIYKKPLAIVMLLITSLLFSYVYYNDYNSFSEIDDYIGVSNTQIEGTISTEKTQYAQYKTVWIENVYVNNIAVEHNIAVTIYDYFGMFGDIEIGNTIAFSSTLSLTEYIYDDTLNTTYLKNDIKYSSSVSLTSITITKNADSFAEIFKAKIKTILESALSVENAELIYSSFFGDKTDLEYSTQQIFSATGLAHILAVSGLHIGIIVLILTYLLKKLKANNIITFIVMVSFLGFYSYICNFSISVTRASIMAIILILSKMFYEEYDILSALSFAGIIAFFICPYSIYDISFLYSFGCVFAIAGFFDYISAALYKIKIRGKINSSLTMSLCAQLGLFGAMILFFEEVQILSIFSNLIVLPLFVLAFTICFIFSFGALLIPLLSYLIIPANFILSIVVSVAKIISSIEFATISMYSIDFLAFLIYNAVIIMWSRYCMLSFTIKIIIHVILCGLFALICI